jgi:hypothetical protein
MGLCREPQKKKAKCGWITPPHPLSWPCCLRFAFRGQNLKVLDKINIDTDTHNHQKSHYTNQEISASYQEIEKIAA